QLLNEEAISLELGKRYDLAYGRPRRITPETGASPLTRRRPTRARAQIPRRPPRIPFLLGKSALANVDKSISAKSLKPRPSGYQLICSTIPSMAGWPTVSLVTGPE